MTINDANLYFSFEYLNRIQVGRSLGSKQTRSKYPSDILNATYNLLDESYQDVFARSNSTYDE